MGKKRHIAMYYKVLYGKAMEEYYTTRQIAKLLMVKGITVRRWIAKGLLQAYSLGKEYRVKKIDFDKFMESRKVKI